MSPEVCFAPVRSLPCHWPMWASKPPCRSRRGEDPWLHSTDRKREAPRRDRFQSQSPGLPVPRPALFLSQLKATRSPPVGLQCLWSTCNSVCGQTPLQQAFSHSLSAATLEVASWLPRFCGWGRVWPGLTGHGRASLPRPAWETSS